MNTTEEKQGILFPSLEGVRGAVSYSSPSPCSLGSVELTISWDDLFGSNRSEMSDKRRRKRWEEWKALKIEDCGSVGVWSDTSACNGCVHLRGGWCKSSGLPAAYNPRLKDLGMACMGGGYETKNENS